MVKRVFMTACRAMEGHPVMRVRATVNLEAQLARRAEDDQTPSAIVAGSQRRQYA